ncbi:hypothetical protein HMI54_010822, partial [Coelomomyces lativittatus]
MSVLIEESGFVFFDTKPDQQLPSPVSKNSNNDDYSDDLLEPSEKNIIVYRDYFLGKPHQNFLSRTTNDGPMAISIVNNKNEFYCVIRTCAGSEHITIHNKDIIQPWWRSLLGFSPTTYHVLNHASFKEFKHHLKPCNNINLPADLLSLEEKMVTKTYKFGLAYLRDGQSTEAEMMSNSLEQVSTMYTEFLSFLGDIIELKGWKAFRAGLDVQNGLTGTHSVYTKWKGFEFMFHVATYLPYVASDPQQ